MNSARLAFKHGIILLLFSWGGGRGGGGACFQTPTISEYIYNTTLLFFVGRTLHWLRLGLPKQRLTIVIMNRGTVNSLLTVVCDCNVA